MVLIVFITINTTIIIIISSIFILFFCFILIRIVLLLVILIFALSFLLTRAVKQLTLIPLSKSRRIL